MIYRPITFPCFAVCFVVLVFMLVFELEFLRHLLADDVLVNLLQHLIRHLLQFPVNFVHILPEILLHHPLQLVHLQTHLLLPRLGPGHRLVALAQVVLVLLFLVQLQLLLDEHGEFLLLEQLLLVLQQVLDMVGPALDLLQLVVELALLVLILVGLELLQGLVLFEGGDVLSQLIHEGRCAVLDEVVDDYEHVQVFPGLLQIVLEHPDPLNDDFDDLLESLEVEGQTCQLVQLGC